MVRSRGWYSRSVLDLVSLLEPLVILDGGILAQPHELALDGISLNIPGAEYFKRRSNPVINRFELESIQDAIQIPKTEPKGIGGPVRRIVPDKEHRVGTWS